MAGNTLGSRRYYRYVDDTGVEFSYLTDQDLGTAVGATEDDSLPGLPRRFKPRGIHCQAEIDGNLRRKFVVIPDTSDTAHWENQSTKITIDSQEFSVTGRRGEQRSFGSNPAAATPTT